VTLYVDDLEVETLPLEPPVGIFINGKTQVGKYVSKETTVPVSWVIAISSNENVFFSFKSYLNKHKHHVFKIFGMFMILHEKSKY